MRILLALLKIQLLDFIREPAALFWSFAFPLLMAIGLGASFTVKSTIERQIGVVTERPEKIPPTIILESKKLGTTTLTFKAMSEAEALKFIKRGEIFLYITPTENSFTYHFDPYNQEGALTYKTVRPYLEKGNVARFHEEEIIVLDSLGTRYIDFLLPGLITLGIMNSCLWGIGYGMVEKRSKKLLRRMVATPMRKWQFLLSQGFARLLITLFETVVLTTFGMIFFQTPLLGSLLAFILLIVSGNFAFLGLSFLVASKTANPQIGNGLISSLTMPMMLLSGIFFSYQNFPTLMLPFIKALPLTLFTDSLRAVMIEGNGVLESLPAIIILSAFGFIASLIGLKIFKWY